MEVPQIPAYIVAQFTPVLKLHPKEKYFPASVDWILARAELRYYEKGVDYTPLDKGQVLIPAGSVTQEGLLDASSRMDGQKLSLVVSPEHYKGEATPATLQDVPVYAAVKLVMGADGLPEAWEISYLTLYTFNGAYNICGLPCIKSGSHVGDWEHLTVRLDYTSFTLQGVFYNAHRSIEGVWRSAHEAPRAPNGQPVAYVAQDGHGLYPTAGSVWRIFCAANDECSAKGPAWKPRRVHLLCNLPNGTNWTQVPSKGCSVLEDVTGLQAVVPPDPRFIPGGEPLPEVVADNGAWQMYTGYWGAAESPRLQDWIRQAEPPVSRTTCQRCCCPCAKGLDRVAPSEASLSRRRQVLQRQQQAAASGRAPLPSIFFASPAQVAPEPEQAQATEEQQKAPGEADKVLAGAQAAADQDGQVGRGPAQFTDLAAAGQAPGETGGMPRDEDLGMTAGDRNLQKQYSVPPEQAPYVQYNAAQQQAEYLLMVSQQHQISQLLAQEEALNEEQRTQLAALQHQQYLAQLYRQYKQQ